MHCCFGKLQERFKKIVNVRKSLQNIFLLKYFINVFPPFFLTVPMSGKCDNAWWTSTWCVDITRWC